MKVWFFLTGVAHASQKVPLFQPLPGAEFVSLRGHTQGKYSARASRYLAWAQFVENLHVTTDSSELHLLGTARIRAIARAGVAADERFEDYKEV
jgi:hypothetical protein